MQPSTAKSSAVIHYRLETGKSYGTFDFYSMREEWSLIRNGPDISEYIRQCVEDEGLDSDEIKERLALMLERTDVWRDTSNPRSQNLFLVQSGNEWLQQAKTRPVPKMLFSEFWFEGELCILFADTNVGKSFLAVQAADAISRGVSPDGINIECESQKVVYFDFEMNSKQFEARFSEKVAGSEH